MLENASTTSLGFFVGGDPADIKRHRRAVCCAPVAAQLRASVCRREQPGIDPARPYTQVLNALDCPFAAQVFGRHQRGMSPVVEFAQVGGDRLFQKTYAVVLTVTVEVGVKTGGNRKLQLDRRSQRRPAQRSFGGDVHDVGPLQRPETEQRLFNRQADSETLITRDRDTGTEYFFEMNVARRSLRRVLARSDQLDPMITPLQPVDDARERHRDTIHLGRVGFRYDCYSRR